MRYEQNLYCTLESFVGFIKEVIAAFGEEYLRMFRESNLSRIFGISVFRGFSYDIGSRKYQPSHWKNGSVAWVGQLKRKGKNHSCFQGGSGWGALDMSLVFW